MRSKFLICFVAVLVLFILPMVSAGIMISQPNALYNLGDDFSVTLDVDDYEEGYFNVDLVCTLVEQKRKNLYYGILTEKTILIERKLIPAYIDDLSGNCFIDASYVISTQTGQGFEISNKLEVNLEISELNYDAGEDIQVRGEVFKENGEFVDGYVEVRLGNETKTSGVVTSSQFDLTFSTLETMPAGTYPLIVEVYDSDAEGTKLNSGESRADLVISQEPERIEIAVDTQTVIPGESIKIIPILYDKAQYEITGEELLLKILDNRGEFIFEKIIISEEEFVFISEYNLAPGYSKIIVETTNGLISNEKVFDVLENAKIKIDVVNETLIITNIGNVDYDKTIEIEVGGKTLLEKISLVKGESKTYEVNAPDGEYGLTVKDDGGILHQGSVALTGDVISISEAGRKIGLLSRYPLVWIFIALILIGIIIVLYKNNRKRKMFSFPTWKSKKKDKPAKDTQGSTSEEDREGKSSIKESLKGIIGLKSNIVKPGAITKAENVLVVNGIKQKAGIIAIKINGEVGKAAKETLNKAIETAQGLKGIPYQMGDNLLLIFSPSVTKTSKNAETAIKASIEIEKILNKHNQKFQDKISYGIGVNMGDIVGRIEGDKFKFTSIGPTINLAKKIANISKGRLLISKEAHEGTEANVKVEKAAPESKEHQMELFRVKSVIDVERNKEFVKDILKKI